MRQTSITMISMFELFCAAKSAVFELEKKVQDPTASGNAISCSVLSGDEVHSKIIRVIIIIQVYSKNFLENRRF